VKIFLYLSKINSILNSAEKKGVLMIFVLSLVSVFFDLLSIGMVLPILTLVVKGEESSTFIDDFLRYLFGNIDHSEILFIVITISIAAFLIKTIMYAFVIWKHSQFSFGLLESLSNRIFSGYVNSSYEYHLQNNSSKLLNNTTNEIGMFVKNLITPALSLLTELIVVLALISLLIYIAPVETIIILTLMSSMIWLINYSTKNKISGWGKERQYHQEKVIFNLQQAFSAIKDIKIIGCEFEFIKRYKYNNKNNIRVAKNQNVIQQIPRIILDLGVIIMIMIIVGFMKLSGSSANDIIPILGVYAAAFYRILPSSNRVISSIQTFKYGLPVLDSINFEFKKLNDIQNKNKNKNKNKKIVNGEIEIYNLDFKYLNDSSYILKEASFKIDSGDVVGVVGRSGSGKSTLIDILLGLLEPTSGKITVSGIDINSNLQKWRSWIGYVPQSICLIDDSIRSNIAFGISSELIIDSRVNNAVKMANLNSLVENLPDGLDSIIGENGVRLSGGQRQRIGLARALYRNPSILILDEATSSLDTETEKKIMDSIYSLSKKMTIIIVAHRVSTLNKCDYIIQVSNKIITRINKKGILE
jgi:ATP-binding cassette, subfamily B, bacterial PglK